jgi:hypothetical protein
MSSCAARGGDCREVLLRDRGGMLGSVYVIIPHFSDDCLYGVVQLMNSLSEMVICNVESLAMQSCGVRVRVSIFFRE